MAEPLALTPAWPLPRASQAPSEAEIRETFARYSPWHYAYEFEGGLSFPRFPGSPEKADRPLQRFRHFMPYLVASQGGTLKGKRVLDIACNSGFWSFQAALLGAEVVGFDGRPELIEQANYLKKVTGIDSVEFKVLDFWDMSPETLGGPFDIVFNLGLLYHLPKPLEALELTKRMARTHILLDTEVHPSDELMIQLRWEEPFDIRAAIDAGVVAICTRPAIELMLRHMRVKQALEIPMRTKDMPEDYLAGKRASWVIEV